MTHKARAFLLVCLALLSSLLLTELFVRSVIGYPTYGVQRKVHYRKGVEYWTNEWKPYSRYWNVEGGNRVFQRNNLGMPGTDINLNSKYRIAVLGSSFVEASQVPPESMAVSVFSRELRKQGIDNCAINLGFSGHDAYDSWLRWMYYQKRYHTDYAVLVLSDIDVSPKWFQRHPLPLEDSLPQGFGSINNSKSAKLQVLLRNNSAIFAVLAAAAKGDNQAADSARKHDKTISEAIPLCPELQTSMQILHSHCPNLSVFSVVKDSTFNHSLQDYCSSQAIPCHFSPLASQYRLHGAGHLNTIGNRILGEKLAASFLSSLQKSPVIPKDNRANSVESK